MSALNTILTRGAAAVALTAVWLTPATGFAGADAVADIAHSLRLVDECGLAFLHVFPYSPRPGTPAARMPQVDGAAVPPPAPSQPQHAQSSAVAPSVGASFVRPVPVESSVG